MTNEPSETTVEKTPARVTALPPDLGLLYLVDDEPDLLFVMKKTIEEYAPAVRVHTFEDPNQALKWIRREPPDVLVTDLRMPGVSGIELIWWARRKVETLPIVIASAFASSAMLSEVTGQSNMEFIEKPFASHALLGAISGVFEESRSRGDEFCGRVRLHGSLDLVQMYAMAQSSGQLRVSGKEGIGRIWFEAGQVIHAATADQFGQDAVNIILSWQGGAFDFVEGEAAPTITIHAPVEHVLLQACLFADDETRRGEPDTLRKKPVEHQNQSAGSPREKGAHTMGNSKKQLQRLTELDGFIGASIVDSKSGMMLDSSGGGAINLELAAAGNSEVLRAKYKTMGTLGLEDTIEDILITLGGQYHLLRPFAKQRALFVYLVLDKSKANLAMGRHYLMQMESSLEI